MMEDKHSPELTRKHGKNPEPRYAYYRRCQVFRRNGEQCKAPAEKGERICHAHAAQQATALRRERERRAVLAEAVAEMRRRGKTEFESLEFEKHKLEAKDLFMSFNGIQVTIAKMAQALIDGRIDCKTAGRLAVDLQTMSKILWLYHRGTQRRALTTKVTKEHKGKDGQGWPITAEAKLSNPLVLRLPTAAGFVLTFPQSSRREIGNRHVTGQQTRAA
ncbi:MAG TPA: hypothetical protein VGK22_02210 [Candidatus Angelobacter sp.]